MKKGEEKESVCMHACVVACMDGRPCPTREYGFLRTIPLVVKNVS